MIRRARLHQVDEYGTELARLGLHRLDVDAVPGQKRRIECRHAEHGLRARLKAHRAGRRLIAHGEGKGPGMAPPASERRQRLILHRWIDENEAGRARPAIQVFISAAHGEIGTRRHEVNVERARTVGQIPHRQRTGGVGARRHCLHVVASGRAIVHLTQTHHRHLRGEGIHHRFRRHHTQLKVAAKARQPLHDVKIGRKIAVIRENDLAPRAQAHRRTQRLEQIDRDGVAHRNALGRCPHQRLDLAAHHARQVEPAMGVPGADEVMAPFQADGARYPLRHPHGQGAQRIAIEIDDAPGQGKATARMGKTVACVQRHTIRPGLNQSHETTPG